jgi:hypothetical protein
MLLCPPSNILLAATGVCCRVPGEGGVGGGDLWLECGVTEDSLQAIKNRSGWEEGGGAL